MKESLSDLISSNSASRTGFVANKTKPIKTRIGKSQKPGNNKKPAINTGIEVAIISSVVFLPILSEIVPERKVPAPPANCNTEREIPAIQRLSPLTER